MAAAEAPVQVRRVGRARQLVDELRRMSRDALLVAFIVERHAHQGLVELVLVGGIRDESAAASSPAVAVEWRKARCGAAV